MNDIVILGSGGLAREVYWWITRCGARVAAFYDENPDRDNWYGYPVVSDLSTKRGMKFVPAVGDPTLKEKLINIALGFDLYPAGSIVDPSAVVVHSANPLAPGVIIGPGCVVSDQVEIKAYTMLNLNVTVGHDTVIGPLCHLAPGVNVSGNVKLGGHSYVGTNACIREKLEIGDRSVIGMGAVVTKNYPAGVTLIGNPAKPKEK